MQTSIEWFIENLLGNGLLRLTKEEHNLYSELRDIAKEIHKKEIIDASIHTVQYNENITLEVGLSIAKKYYQETFKKD
jgi:hypothetical protein